MAVLTGVIASGLVSISIELANNYRHNRQRFIVLNEYLYIVSDYESFIKWSSHGDYVSFDEQEEIHLISHDAEWTPRLKAVSEVILQIAPIIEDTVDNYKEFLQLGELMIATRATDAFEKIYEYINDITRFHLKKCDLTVIETFEEPFQSKIRNFVEDENIDFSNEDVNDIVIIYILDNINDLGTLSNDSEVNEIEKISRKQIITELHNFDRAMHELQNFIKWEPVVYENLIPIEDTIKRYRKKLGTETIDNYEELRKLEFKNNK